MRTASAITNTMKIDAVSKRKRDAFSEFGLMLIVFHLLDYFCFVLNVYMDRTCAPMGRFQPVGNLLQAGLSLGGPSEFVIRQSTVNAVT